MKHIEACILMHYHTKLYKNIPFSVLKIYLEPYFGYEPTPEDVELYIMYTKKGFKKKYAVKPLLDMGLSQKQVAEILEMSQQAVSKRKNNPPKIKWNPNVYIHYMRMQFKEIRDEKARLYLQTHREL